MSLPPANAIAPWLGYEHWDPQDQPYFGVDGITAEQRLWHHFNNEVMLRTVAKYIHQQNPHFINDLSERLAGLPAS